MGFDAIEEFFQTRGSDVFHEVSPLAGVEAFATLAKRGYRPSELSNVLFRPVEPRLDTLEWIRASGCGRSRWPRSTPSRT